MLLAVSRAWRAELSRDGDAVAILPVREGLPEDAPELRELRFDVPLERWNAVVKHANSDRKLLGGLLLDFANDKETVGAAVSRDRLWLELSRVVLEATVALVAAGCLVLAPPPKDAPVHRARARGRR
jgi:hypothetical protein